MAEKKDATDEVVMKSEKEYWNERVPFKAFKDNGKYKDDLVVGINGKLWRIQRGVKIMIPRNVREVIYQSMDQDAATANLIERESNAYNDASRWLN
ncbi:MAG: hypothetical protein IJK86_03860 [Lachnospiraceae bacterium]|nr:hypothetical protein [Clostridia bacterium]MBQ6075270.1 hypothetical protein [Lachnospiraceae bacterium]MBQ6232809.1 hypothetical protein [Clostridia bacterium]MBR0209527.1 hypothetical protein [Bacillota bacterium]